LATQEGAANAVIVLDRAIQQISESQAKLGAIQNRLDYNISNLTKASMLTETAKGRIMDADYAAETAILVKNQILAQAATQALSMANQSKQGVLGLLG
jgi:flagellin